MLEQLKQGAVYALIMAFLAQPVWAATQTGVFVNGPGAWVNNAPVTATAIEPSYLSPAIATGALINSGYASAGQTLAVNDVLGELRVSAEHTSAETVFSSKTAVATGIKGNLGIDGVLIRNLGVISVEANTVNPVAHDTHGGAAAYGIQTITNNNVENNGEITLVAVGTSALALGVDTAGDLSGTPTDILNGMNGIIDITASATTGNLLARGISKTNNPGSVSNDGQIIVNAQRISPVGAADVEVYGIRATDSENIYTNDGLIDIFGQNSGDGLLRMAGIYLANGIQMVSNTGTINVEGVSFGTDFVERSVSGVYHASTMQNDGNINVVSSGASSTIGVDGVASGMTNTGTITVSATSGLDGFGYTGAIGVKDVGGDLINSGGDVIVSDTSSHAIATGITNSFGVENSGNISVTATSTTGGQAQADGIDGTIVSTVNDGTVAVTATSTLAGGSALGVGIDSASSFGSVSNTGDIAVTVESDLGSDAVGVNVSSGLTSSGTIKVFASTLSDPLAARGAGVSAWSAIGPISSSGTIVAGSTGEASGFDLTGTGSVTNTGTVRVAGDDGMYGIFLRGGTWNVANSGTIQGYDATDVLDESTWSATNGFRTLRVGQDVLSAPAVATLTSAFQVILDGDPDGVSYMAPIFVAEGSSLNLNSQDLIATPGANVTLNRGYRIIENEGTVTGTFGGLVAGNPAITTTWSGADNGEGAEVTFGFEPEETPITPAPAEVAITMADTATDQLRQFAMSNALRGTEIAPEGPTAIVRPWAGNLNRSKKDGVGYNAGMAGVLAGVEVPVNSDLVVGGHAVAGGAKVDYTGTGYSSNSEDQSMFGVGAHGRWTPGDWYLDGMLTSYMVNHDYSGRTGLNLELDEDDEYESYGVEASLIGGHKFRHDNITAMPFAGLGYSWLNTPGHETETATGTWQTRYGTLDEHNVRAIVGARISAEYAAFDGTITPALGLRYEHSLTDNDIRIRQSLQGASENVEGERADGSVILDAGLTYGRGPLALEIGGAIEKNDDYDAQSGFIGVRWTF